MRSRDFLSLLFVSFSPLPHPMLHQTFELHDLVVIGILVLLEGLLSLDNALVLGLLDRGLPKE